MFSAVPEKAKAYDGSTVLTDARMKMFAWWFESKIASCKDVKNYTLSAASMKIPGVTVVPEVHTGVPELVEGPLIERMNLNNRASTGSGTVDISSFLADLNTLASLINQAVEKCIIAGPNLQNELSIIEQKIAESPLEQIVALARPVTDDILQMYTSLQKTMNIYLQNIPS